MTLFDPQPGGPRKPDKPDALPPDFDPYQWIDSLPQECAFDAPARAVRQPAEAARQRMINELVAGGADLSKGALDADHPEFDPYIWIATAPLVPEQEARRRPKRTRPGAKKLFRA